MTDDRRFHDALRTGVRTVAEFLTPERDVVEQSLAGLRERLDVIDSQERRSSVPAEHVLGSAGRARAGHGIIRRTTWYALAGTVFAVLALVATWSGIRAYRHAPAPAAVSTYLTQNGQRANIVLSDGTTVALDVASRLDVPVDYAAGNHTVRLTGEAMFTVAHHDGAPFTVVSGGMTTRVLGTSFLVRHYATDVTTTVAVRDGKVAVRANVAAISAPVVLTANRQVDISNTGALRVDAADPSAFSFMRGVLTITGVPLKDAIPMLDRWYDADIRLGDPALAEQQLAGEFSVGSLADLTNYLVVTFNVRVERVGRVLTLFPR